MNVIVVSPRHTIRSRSREIRKETDLTRGGRKGKTRGTRDLVRAPTPRTLKRTALRRLTELASGVPVVADSFRPLFLPSRPSLSRSTRLLPHRQLRAMRVRGVALRVAGEQSDSSGCANASERRERAYDQRCACCF